VQLEASHSRKRPKTVIAMLTESFASETQPFKNNIRFLLQISYAGCLGLSSVISAPAAVKIEMSVINRENNITFWTSRSFKIINVFERK